MVYNSNTRTSPLFTYAVVADTHVMPDGGSNTAPYAVLLKANQRTRKVIAEISKAKPAFVVHLGDMVRPFPALSNYSEVCDLALDMFQKLPCPIHYIPGNHDIGDKPIASAPAPGICNAYIEKYRRKFGNTYSSFEYEDHRFILLNSSVINSGLQEEDDQWDWLEQQAANTSQKRCFVFIHYPPFLAYADEHSHYDNLDEPGRSRLLSLVSKMKAEALFSGHVHHFFYNRYEQTDIYCMPSTTFTRHDFSELFAITPAEEAEFGRDDSAKLGYALVDVYADNYVVRLVNTLGARTSDGVDSNISEPLPGIHPRDGFSLPVAVQLRHSWNELRALPSNAPLDDFNRKKARNDYPILATWQMGISWLRVPVDDLEDEQTRVRMDDLRKMGQRFIIMNFDVPGAKTTELIRSHVDLVDALEIILPRDSSTEATDSLKEWNKRFGIPVYSGYLESSATLPGADVKYFAHTTSFGYRISNPGLIEVLLESSDSLPAACDGILFHIPSTENVLTEMSKIISLCEKIEKSAMVHVMNAQSHPATGQFNQQFVANRTACALIGALSLSKGIVVLDTLMDIDRGDFPRAGLIDRRGNRNLAGQYLQNLSSVLVSAANPYEIDITDIVENDGAMRVSFQQQDFWYQLYLANSNENKISILEETQDKYFGNMPKDVRCIDLESGHDIVDQSISPTGNALLFQWKDAQ